MIHITQDQNIAEHEHLRVITPTGDYEDGALIEFYDINEPNVVAGSFQAQFVVYGSLVYRCNGHVDLGNAILAIDPNSTHTAASYVRMSNQLLAQMDEGSLEATSLDEVVNAEQVNMDEKRAEPSVMEKEIEEVSLPEVVNEESILESEPAINVDTSTSTPPLELGEAEVLGESIEGNASTTPVLEGGSILDDTSTSTSEISPEILIEPASTTELMQESSTRKIKLNKIIAQAKKRVVKKKV